MVLTSRRPRATAEFASKSSNSSSMSVDYGGDPRRTGTRPPSSCAGGRCPLAMAKLERTHGTVSLPVPPLEEINKVVRVGLMGFRSRAELPAEATRTPTTKPIGSSARRVTSQTEEPQGGN